MEINYNKPIKNSFKQNYPNSIPQLNSSSESNNTVSNHIVVNRRWTRLDPIGDDAIFFSSPPHCNARVPLIICNRIPRWNSHFVSLYSFLHPLTTYPQLIIPILVRHSPRAELFAVSFCGDTHCHWNSSRCARVCEFIRFQSHATWREIKHHGGQRFCSRECVYMDMMSVEYPLVGPTGIRSCLVC